MLVTESIAVVRTVRAADPRLTWGLVPTMGFLHEGHLALVRRAAAENDRVAVSIFVNPTQFAPTEDLSTYPRDLERDLALVRAAGAHLVFVPAVAEMYPAGFQTTVQIGEVARSLEGAARPTHFAGVATVVAKLLNIVQPTRAYFGQKDAQQTVVVRRMTADLNIPTEIVVAPTVREPDGLALSSRNTYLTPEQRRAAPVLYRALQTAEQALQAGERDGERLRAAMRDVLAAEPAAQVEYVSAADPTTLTELAQVGETALLSLAVRIGRTRLIDNILWRADAVS